MFTNARKALIGLSLVASCGVALTPSLATAQTTLPTITVIGHRPQSQAYIQGILDQVRQPSLLLELAELLDVVDAPSYPEQSLTLYTIDCRLSQDARTNAVTHALTIPNVNTGSSPYLAFGTEVTVHYMNGNASERFVVTGGGSGAPNSDPVRALTPVAGSLVCPP
jgi:hypothetical protein